MAIFDSSKLIKPCGKITNSTLGGYVDAAGNIVGSPQFLANFIVDYAGNLRSLVTQFDCTLIAEIIGTAFDPGPWEVQVGTAETIGSDMSVNSTNYSAGTTATTLLSNFASANTTGIMSGVVSGGGNWTIMSGPQTIGGVTYPGGGLIITTAANSITGTTIVQGGAKFQVGADETNTTAKVNGLTVQGGATATLFGANTANFYITQALINSGTTNITGPDVCGQGVLLSTTINNAGGVINIKDAVWRNQSTWTGGGGSLINVLDGGTFRLTTNAISNTQININGCGWCDANGKQVGAIEFTAAFALGANVNVKSPSCIGAFTGANVGGILSGSQPLKVFPPVIGALPTQNITFGNASNTYHGELTIDNTTLVLASQSLQYADIVLERAARISGTGIIGSLESADQSTYWVQASGNSYINSNGETTFAGRFIGDGVTARNHWLEGGEENILRLTHTSTIGGTQTNPNGGHTATLYARNGSKVYLENGTKFTTETGQIRISLGSTLSSNTTTSSATYIYLDTGAILDVQAINSTTASLITAIKNIASSGGYKVNVPAGLVAGSYPILQANAGGTIVPQLPTINQNLSGLNASFAWNAANPRILTMTLN